MYIHVHVHESLKDYSTHHEHENRYMSSFTNFIDVFICMKINTLANLLQNHCHYLHADKHVNGHLHVHGGVPGDKANL